MQKELIESKIKLALERMESKGHKNTEGYKNLESKLAAIERGYEYRVTNVAESLIKAMSSFIPVCNTFINPERNYKNSHKKIQEAVEYARSLEEGQ